MVEKVFISPNRVRAYGNIVNMKTGDDFTLVNSELTVTTDTVDGAEMTVFSMEVEPRITVTATNPYLVSGETTDLVVSLVNAFGSPISGKTVTVSDGTSVYNGITNNQGIYTLSDVSVSGYTTFTATYGSVTATCIVHDISDSLFGEVYCLMNDLTTLRANNPFSQSTLSLSSDWKITGEQSLKFVVGSSAKYFGIRTGANYLDITEDIKGKTVRFSAYVNSQKQSYLSIYRFVNNSWVSTGSRLVVPSGEQYAEVTFTLESNADYYWFRLEPYTNSGTDGDTIYTDAWTLEVLD